MRKIGMVRALGIGVACVTAMASTASAAANSYAGDLCNPTTPGDAAKISYSQYGVRNTASSAANVSCGGSPTPGTNVDQIGAVVYDRNSSADVCCTMLVRNGDGTVITSAVKCSTGSAAFVPQVLIWNPPANLAGTVSLQCTIPATTGTGSSNVTTYTIRTTP